jgi:hypothetical protein
VCDTPTHSGGLGITSPVRIIHSLVDEEVPYATALKLADCIQTPNVKIILSKRWVEVAVEVEVEGISCIYTYI